MNWVFIAKNKWLKGMGLAALCSLIFVLTYFSYVKYFDSDPELTLLVSQTILESGATRLDGYQDRLVLGRPFTTFINSPKIITTPEGHYYSYFPVGPAVLSLPFVAAARWGGLDMSQLVDSYLLQQGLAALSVVAVFLILYQTARLYLDDKTSLVISLTATLGSTVTSTMGVALWSINFATIFVALSLYLLAKRSESWLRWMPYALGLFLFLAFFARVSTAAFITPVLLYLFVTRRRLFWPTAVTALLLLFLFLLWSRLEFGQWLPAYYSAQRLAVERVAMWIGVYGNLLSPSRGIFIFSPFLGLGVLGAIFYRRLWGQHPLIWVILLWFVLLLLIIARGSSWWGGASFGPRILTEVIPGLTLLLVLVWHEVAAVFSRTQHLLAKGVYIVLAVFAIFIHSFQGLYSGYAAHWSSIVDPIPDLPVLGLGDLFNWQYTQLLASPDWNCAITRDRFLTLAENLPILKDYKWGQAIQYSDQLFSNFVEEAIHEMEAQTANFGPGAVEAPDSTGHHLFLPFLSRLTNRTAVLGIGAPKNGNSWSESTCQTVSIIFQLSKSPASASRSYTLLLTAGSYGEQPIVLEVNGTAGGKQVLNKSPNEPGTVLFLIPGHWLNWQGLNEIELQLPEARFTGLQGGGYSGLTFVEAVLYPSPSSKFAPDSNSPPPAYP